ncbi:MAG TPA: VOC family protein [Gaiellales bacterium]|nr:VOC family protein [Gaiellales bacterium]
MIELDHVVIAVPDLPAAATSLADGMGLTSVEGGRHAGWGTANRIVPLGETYLELVAVVDADEAAASAFGGWVAAAAGAQPIGWVVRTDGIDQVAGRLGLTVSEGTRRDREGRPMHWRVAGVERARTEPSLPFFVEWGEGTPHPGRTGALTGGLIAEVRVRGDRALLTHWLGGADLPVAVEPGEPAVEAVVVGAPGGEVVLDRAALGSGTAGAVPDPHRAD